MREKKYERLSIDERIIIYKNVFNVLVTNSKA